MTPLNSSAKKSSIGILGLPFDENSSIQRGCADAPPLIRAALFSDAMNLWTENGIDLGEAGLLVDAGDLPPCLGDRIFPEIEQAVDGLLGRKVRPIALGGDHAISYPLIRAVSRRYPALTVLDFDAHPDLYDHYQENRHSHACPFARIMEEGLVRRLVQVGIRTMNEAQRQQKEKFGVEVIEMKDWNGVLSALQSPLYISFDMDVLDPAFAPGISHREPGGMPVRQALGAIQALRAEIVGADIVEFNPRMDVSNLTAPVCAKLVKEIAAAMWIHQAAG